MLVGNEAGEPQTVQRSPALRLGAGIALRNVEVSINGDSWHRCRPCQGFWWYDWQGFLPGQKYILARATTRRGEKVITLRRRFSVEFE